MWRPDLLVPVEHASELQGNFDILASIALPNGSVRIMGVASEDEGRGAVGYGDRPARSRVP